MYNSTSRGTNMSHTTRMFTIIYGYMPLLLHYSTLVCRHIDPRRFRTPSKLFVVTLLHIQQRS